MQVVLTVPADTCVPGTTVPDASAPEADLAGATTPTAEQVRSVPRGNGAPTATARTGLTTGPIPSSVVAAFDDDDDLVQVQGARPSEPLLVPRGWLRSHLTSGRAHEHRVGKRADGLIAPCAVHTGARLDPDDDLSSSRYRPGTALAALVRSRDGRCRFPGCTVAARFCDLDHVRPWPTGRTRAANLLSLCRRHHRVKQSAGWTVRLTPDGIATWTEPTGRVRTTWPLDALESLVLGADPVADVALGVDSTPQGRTSRSQTSGPREGSVAGTRTAPPAAWSVLESCIELHLDHRPRHRYCTTAADLQAARTARRRRRIRAAAHDPPPF